ncbi:MAG TPA: NAD(P)H-quinone oxidoreductase [Gemmatimonadales bacterium]|jgi:putative PIG3 family NAD(P)H quinone oxidoreductase
MLAVTHPAPDVTEIVTRPDPVPGPNDVAVSVHASGLNRADLLQRAGRYPAPPGWPADIPGLEYAGTIDAIGSQVRRWSIGDRVMGLVGGGGHAQRLTVHEDEAITIPDGMSFTDAAAIPEAFLTAWDAMVMRGRAVAGDRVLVHAIGSGVGTAAAQLGRALAITIIGTSRTPEKLQRCAELGMAHGILTSEPEWTDRVGGLVQVVVDTLGAQAFEANLSLLEPQGRLVLLGTMTGAKAPSADLGMILRRRLEVIGTAMRVRDRPERIELAARFSSNILPMFSDGTLRPVIDRVVPMREIEAAYRALAANETFGKIVLRW